MSDDEKDGFLGGLAVGVLLGWVITIGALLVLS